MIGTDTTAPPPSASSGEKHKHPRQPWRDNIEAITMAIVMAVMLKYFVVEAYKIPTGSMQPTLMGNQDTQIFDRILVDKLSYHFRDPERFEVVVFKYPLDHSKNFIKRLVGVGPEELLIRNGDLWNRPDGEAPWRVLRRPARVQRETWKALHPGEGGPGWRVLGSSATAWDVKGGRVEARGTGSIRYPDEGHGVLARYLDGYPPKIRDAIRARRRRPGEEQVVGDLRVEAEVRALEGCESVEVELRENERSYFFTLPGPAAPPQARVSIRSRGGEPIDAAARLLPDEALLERPFRLGAGRTHRIAAQNLDDLLALEIDGERVLELEVWEVAPRSSSAFVHVQGEGADISELMVSRDIYYTSDRAKEKHFRIEAGHYVMLGDNTQDSSDSREWTWARFQWPGLERELRGNNRENDQEAPNPQRVPGAPGGTQIWVRDEWGELYHAPLSQVRELPPQEAPYVPRDRITGRALVVFWPLKWDLKLWRLKWIR